MNQQLKKLPRGWTDNPRIVDYEHEWASEISPGQQMAQTCDLPRAEPIMYDEDTISR